jgi:hypothetical protein
MKPDWKIDLSIYIAGCIVERIGPQPSRRVYIPKADGRGNVHWESRRWEDKIVQQAVVTVLNEIYEVDFKGFSYGFRPGRGPHQALDALAVGHPTEASELGARCGHSEFL